MQANLEKSKSVASKRWRLAAVTTGIVLGGGFASFAVIGQSGPPNIQKLDIASVPLYASTQGDKPALALALSVEFPTVGAQYVDQPGARTDSSYDPKNEYLGYYNAEMCYTYQDNPVEAPAAGKTKADYKRFVINGPAKARQCADAFSGNFLNWASSSAIDMLRLALAGGDRIVDENNLTILQRAVLPDNSLADGPGCFWNSSNFPAKELKKGAGSNYFGAVPQSMRTAANNKGAESIWVANILNRVYFGTKQGGDCKNTGGYDLSVASYHNGMGSVSKNLPANAFAGTGTACARESQTCSTGGKIQQVWYGHASKGWATAPVMGSFSCNNATFGDPANGVVKSCYLTEYTGTWRPSVASQGLNSDGFFYSRAEVCSRDASGNLLDKRDYRFCEKYPNGNYKPIGTIQHYSSQLRLAAFGYAIDNTLSYGASQNPNNGRYGGVLRAPMKYVGPKQYDIYGQESGVNPRAEWDQQTGIFVQNPEKDSLGNSGVINYLNKFGRLLPDRPGNYKIYDPASELYYEVLRYMQGLHPSPAAVSGLTSAMYDGFPIYTDWSSLDPYAGRSNAEDYSCLKSNIALIGDVNTHDSKSYGKSRMPNEDLSNNVPNIEHWLKVVQAFESKQSVEYFDGAGNKRSTSNPNAASYSGYPASTDRHRSAELIGLSYWAHTHDIRGKSWTAMPEKQRPGLRVKSFIFDVNEYSRETDSVKRHTNNQYYTAAKYGGFNTQPAKSDDIPYNTEGNPFYDQKGKATNDLWRDVDYKPDPRFPNRINRELEPNNYYLQSDARGVLEAFEKIFSTAASSLRNIAGASLSSGDATSTDLYQYQATFDTASWSGDVIALELKLNGAAERQVWSAEEKLRARISDTASNRKIFVGAQRSKTNPNPTTRATEFTVTAIENELKDMLNKPGVGAAVDNLWKERVDYLRGVKNKEGSLFRERSRAMGDVVNSGVVFMGSPSVTLSSDTGYAQHVSARKNRKSAVYVGANDGMMHAFDAKTGEELFAYIPSWMGPRLSALTNIRFEHRSYVDATPVVGEAKTGTGSTKDDWKTVLVSGTGGGGKGVFALDVSDPEQFAADKVIWEFTQVNDPDMGHVIGKSRIVKMQVEHKTNTGGKDKYRWFALVPAGANNYVDNGDGIYSKTGDSTIFLLALDKPVDENWQLDKNYYKVSLPFNSSLYNNGISGPTRATGIIALESFTNNVNGAIDLVYAGDLHGNVWALKFTGLNASEWNAASLSRFKTGGGATLAAIPMYAAQDAMGNPQPITSAPSILRIGSTDTYMVGLGTGKYIESTDIKNTQANTYYVLYDDGKGVLTSSNGNGSPWRVGIAGRGRLQQVGFNGVGLAPLSTGFRWGRPSSDIQVDVRAGWYYDLPETGERVISDGVAIPYTSRVKFGSIIPDAASKPGICPVDGGSSKQYDFDYFTAQGTVRVSPVGLAGQPLLLLDNTDLGKADSTGRRLRKVKPYTVYPGTQKSAAEEGKDIYIPVGRLSWRQINNYLELRNQQ